MFMKSRTVFPNSLWRLLKTSTRIQWQIYTVFTTSAIHFVCTTTMPLYVHTSWQLGYLHCMVCSDPAYTSKSSQELKNETNTNLVMVVSVLHTFYFLGLAHLVCIFVISWDVGVQADPNSISCWLPRLFPEEIIVSWDIRKWQRGGVSVPWSWSLRHTSYTVDYKPQGSRWLKLWLRALGECVCKNIRGVCLGCLRQEWSLYARWGAASTWTQLKFIVRKSADLEWHKLCRCACNL